MITKIQKLSAIHNVFYEHLRYQRVVCDYKDTKIVSNSQLEKATERYYKGCL